MKWKVKVLVTESCRTLFNPMDCSPPGSPSLEFSRQEHWSRYPFIVQGIFPTQGLNLGLPYRRQIRYCLSQQGSLRLLIQGLKSYTLLRIYFMDKLLSVLFMSLAKEHKHKRQTVLIKYKEWWQRQCKPGYFRAPKGKMWKGIPFVKSRRYQLGESLWLLPL